MTTGETATLARAHDAAALCDTIIRDDEPTMNRAHTDRAPPRTNGHSMDTGGEVPKPTPEMTLATRAVARPRPGADEATGGSDSMSKPGADDISAIMKNKKIGRVATI